MVALAQLAAKAGKLSVIGSLMLVALGTSAVALNETVVESSATRFSGDKYNDSLASLGITHTGDHFAESGYSTQIAAQQILLVSMGPDVYGDETKTLERRGSIAVDQTIDQLTTIGASYGYTLATGASKTFNRYYSGRIGQWWNKATILTSLEVTHSGTDRKSRDYMDTDGLRVVTPKYVSGKNYTLGVTWLATTYAMVIARATVSTSSDRPVSDSGNLEGRYFLSETRTAFHLKIAAQNDRSGVAKNTDYGQIHGRGIEGQIHQHISDQWIGAVVHRRHFETETPRSSDSPTINKSSSASQLRLRWRNVTGPVTENVSEIYGYIGQYQSTDSDSLIRHVGIGGKYVL